MNVFYGARALTWFVFAGAMTLAGCGGGQTAASGEGTQGLEGAQENPIGRWVGERHSLMLHPKGWYDWEQPLPCELPPCKTRRAAGRYAFKGANRIKLLTEEGEPAGELVYHLTPEGRLRFKHTQGGPAYELSQDTAP
ncbi:MAG: hypothetical protein ACE366_22540 [Bradymonadia bacterium]